ncbi:hypothetical protein D6764_03950 [Candidatus Woesearchaeota archaeon]|nr:MAG: hypothetical protein D6764_03950 [Candidatus Woesearchaeota archaeon]
MIDAYTRRIFSRLGVINKEEDYDSLQQTFHKELSDAGFEKSQLYNEYHALIVEHAKRHCTAKPLCEGCPIRAFCAYARSGNHGRQQKIKRQ